MAALQVDKTLAELSGQYKVQVNQIQTWRNQLNDNRVSLSDSSIVQSNVMDTDFCNEAIDRYGTPKIFITDQGSLSKAFTGA